MLVDSQMVVSTTRVVPPQSVLVAPMRTPSPSQYHGDRRLASDPQLTEWRDGFAAIDGALDMQHSVPVSPVLDAALHEQFSPASISGPVSPAPVFDFDDDIDPVDLPGEDSDVGAGHTLDVAPTAPTLVLPLPVRPRSPASPTVSPPVPTAGVGLTGSLQQQLLAMQKQLVLSAQALGSTPAAKKSRRNPVSLSTVRPEHQQTEWEKQLVRESSSEVQTTFQQCECGSVGPVTSLMSHWNKTKSSHPGAAEGRKQRRYSLALHAQHPETGFTLLEFIERGEWREARAWAREFHLSQTPEEQADREKDTTPGRPALKVGLRHVVAGRSAERSKGSTGSQSQQRHQDSVGSGSESPDNPLQSVCDEPGVSPSHPVTGPVDDFAPVGTHHPKHNTDHATLAPPLVDNLSSQELTASGIGQYGGCAGVGVSVGQRTSRLGTVRPQLPPRTRVQPAPRRDAVERVSVPRRRTSSISSLESVGSQCSLPQRRTSGLDVSGSVWHWLWWPLIQAALGRHDEHYQPLVSRNTNLMDVVTAIAVDFARRGIDSTKVTTFLPVVATVRALVDPTLTKAPRGETEARLIFQAHGASALDQAAIDSAAAFQGVITAMAAAGAVLDDVPDSE
jgi:hypothetical protein